jgi:hypothetical protein
MATGGKKRKRSPKDVKSFDPQKSLRAGVEILEKANVPFALAGRLAVWTYVSSDRQQFTKDVDFAVPYGYSEQAVAVAKEMGFTVTKLTLGYNVRKGELLIDFVDHHPHLEKLFLAAVKAAKEDVEEDEIPVVPLDFLIAMKLAAGRQKDDSDVIALLKEIDAEEYQSVRRLVRRELGYGMATRLDMVARSVGHEGPGMEIDS